MGGWGDGEMGGWGDGEMGGWGVGKKPKYILSSFEGEVIINY
ncbi:hypothetical protein [Okeania sp. SIO3B5]|nr:hypothetical protein [Okeania sp. SIO3B5]